MLSRGMAVHSPPPQPAGAAASYCSATGIASTVASLLALLLLLFSVTQQQQAGGLRQADDDASVQVGSGIKCFAQSRITYDPVLCDVPGDGGELCLAGLPNGYCALVVATAELPERGWDAAVRAASRLGRVVLVSGDSMGRQTLLTFAGFIRSGAPPSESTWASVPLAEHYLHCDLVYVVFKNGTDALLFDIDGHCGDGTNAEYPTSWTSRQLAGVSADDAHVLVVVFAWQQVTGVGTRVQDMERVLTPGASTHIIVPSYTTEMEQMSSLDVMLDAGFQRTRPTLKRAVLVLFPPRFRSPQHEDRIASLLTQRNAAVRKLAEVRSSQVTLVDWSAETHGRCDGVHFMCIVTPMPTVGQAQKLRAPCPSCNASSAFALAVRVWLATP